MAWHTHSGVKLRVECKDTSCRSALSSSGDCLSFSDLFSWSLAHQTLSSYPPAQHMASSPKSVAPPIPPPSLELEIHELKRKLSAHKRFFLWLDGEGGRRFEMLKEDLIQLREEVVESLA
jgi:hypothetical protein